MKVIKRIADNVVLFAGDDVALDAEGASGAGWVAAFVTTDGHVVDNAQQLPDGFAGGCFTYSAGVWAMLPEVQAQADAAAAAQLVAGRAALVLRIDADVDAIYGAVLGNRAQEYTLAEEHALAYEAAGFTGTVPGSVEAWAAATHGTAQWAAESIIATATAWRAAQATIRAQRLLRKEQARISADQHALDTVAVQWAGFVSVARAQLGLPT